MNRLLNLVLRCWGNAADGGFYYNNNRELPVKVPVRSLAVLHVLPMSA